MLQNYQEIIALQQMGNINISPFDLDLVNTASYDITLGSNFIRNGYNQDVVGSIFLYPGEFLLAHTEEKVTLDRTVAAQLDGKSTLARQGLVVHLTAGWIDPGFSGQITLEIKNLTESYLQLTVGQRIGQLKFFRINPTAMDYTEQPNAKYNNSVGVVLPK